MAQGSGAEIWPYTIESCLASQRRPAESVGEWAFWAAALLIVLVDARDERPDGERIRAAIPDWASTSPWFRGPRAFRQSLRSDFVARGLPAMRFHRELLQIR